MNNIKNHWLLFVLLMVSTLIISLSYSLTLEDAQITYRYALRYSEGFPWGTWNRSEAPVEGFTTTLWMFTLSLFGPDLQAIIHSSKIIGALSALGLVALYYQVAFQSQHDKIKFIDNSDKIKNSAIFTSLFCALFLPLSWYATTGMETTTYILLISASLFYPLLNRNIYIFSIICFCLVLIRPEGIAFALASSIFYSVRDKRYFIPLAISLIALTVIFITRYNYFGVWMPNTYYAKSGDAGLLHIKYGIAYFGSFLISYWYVFAPFLSIPILLKKGVISFKRDLFYFLIIIGSFFYYCIIAKSGADNFSAFPHWRHGLILLPIIVFCSFYTIFSLEVKSKFTIAKSLIILSIISPILLVIPSNQNLARYYQLDKISFKNDALTNSMFIWLKEHNSPNITIATSLAGALPLTIDFNHIDILGLNDALIAHEGHFDLKGPIDSKTEMSYVVARQPEIIEAYVKPNCVKENNVKCLLFNRRKMVKDLFTNSEFVSNYLMIDNAPYDSFNRAMFIRKDYYENVGVDKGIIAIEWKVSLKK